MTIHAESEKVLNVPSILRVTVLMFFNVEYLRGNVFSLWNLLTVIDLNSMVKYSIDLIPYEDPQTTSNLMWITEFRVKFIKMFLNICNFENLPQYTGYRRYQLFMTLIPNVQGSNLGLTTNLWPCFGLWFVVYPGLLFIPNFVVNFLP